MNRVIKRAIAGVIGIAFADAFLGIEGPFEKVANLFAQSEVEAKPREMSLEEIFGIEDEYDPSHPTRCRVMSLEGVYDSRPVCPSGIYDHENDRRYDTVQECYEDEQLEDADLGEDVDIKDYCDQLIRVL